LIAGSVLAPRVLAARRALGFAYVGNFAIVPLLVLLSTSHSAWLVAGSSAVAGVAVAVFGVTYTTLLQRTIPPQTISRVASYFWLARAAPTPIALALAGPASARFGISAVFAAAALSVTVATLIGAGFADVWRVGNPNID